MPVLQQLNHFMGRLLKIIKIFIFSMVTLFALSVLGVMSLYQYYSRDLPRLDTLKDYNPPVISEVFADDGTKIGEFWEENRIVLPKEELPKTIVQAIIASEDDRFFQHRGLDFQGIIRAFFENLKAGHVVQGGSTITQQVTKSLLLTKERTLVRKVKEAILATRIEKKFTKDEILYLYLNQIFFGNRAYGIEAAARNYFHKSAMELNIAEASLIAGLAKAPTTFSPLTNPERARNRQHYVIDRMLAEGFITHEQAEKAKKAPLAIYRAGTDKEFNNQYAPWFTEYIRRTIQETLGEKAPYTQGLKIYTTLDLSLQKAADHAMDRGLRELDKRQGYLGPLAHLLESEIEKKATETHLKLARQAQPFFELSSPFLETELLNQQTPPLTEGKNQEAIITALDNKGQQMEVLVGKQKGFIRVHDYAWIHKRNLNNAGYNDVYYTRDPSSQFKVGDGVLVRKKIPTDEEIKSKGYEPSENYFSLEQEPEVEGALFSYDPFTGFVKAIVGGKDFKKSEFNRAMQAIRQTGSAIKPLIYAAALDKGYTVNTVIEDSPLSYEYSPGRFWTPQNYGGDFKGPTSFRSGLVNSRNVVTVKILMDIGVDYATGYARKLGISTPIKRYYSMALGANDMKLYELSRAYGSFVTGGILPELVFVKRMTDRHGRVLKEHIPREIVAYSEQLQEMQNQGDSTSKSLNDELWQTSEPMVSADKLDLNESEKRILYGSYIPKGYTLSPRTAYTMVQLMNDIVNFGTGYKIKELKKPAAGKTGTTNDETDTWFVGFVPDLFCGVWVGFDDIKRLGARETGGKTAAPIFLYYMQQVLKDKEVAEFKIPDDINDIALKAPLNEFDEDAEAGGLAHSKGGAEFFIYDF